MRDLLHKWTGQEFARRRIQGRDNASIDLADTGDVICLGRDINFSIECKIQEGFSLEAMMKSPDTALFSKWWHQSVYDAMLLSQRTGYKKYPLLFFKPIMSQDWIAISADNPIKYRSGEALIHGLSFKYHGLVSCNTSRNNKRKVMKELELGEVLIYRWKDFSRAMDPERFFVTPCATAASHPNPSEQPVPDLGGHPRLP